MLIKLPRVRMYAKNSFRLSLERILSLVVRSEVICGFSLSTAGYSSSICEIGMDKIVKRGKINRKPWGGVRKGGYGCRGSHKNEKASRKGGVEDRGAREMGGTENG